MSAQPSGAIARVRWGLRFGDVDWVERDGRGQVVEVVVRWDDDGSSSFFHNTEIEELVWL